MTTSSKELENDQAKLDEAFARAKAAIKAGQKPDANDLFRIVQSKAADRRQRALAENAGPTAKEIAARITEGVKDVVGGNLFHASQGLKLSDSDDSVMVTYASVPRNAPEIDALNAKTNPMWHIVADKGHSWFVNGPSPAKIRIEHFRGSIQLKKDTGPPPQFLPEGMTGKDYRKANKVQFRAKSDTPDKIIKYLVDFFHKNREAFKP